MGFFVTQLSKNESRGDRGRRLRKVFGSTSESPGYTDYPIITLTATSLGRLYVPIWQMTKPKLSRGVLAEVRWLSNRQNVQRQDDSIAETATPAMREGYGYVCLRGRLALVIDA